MRRRGKIFWGIVGFMVLEQVVLHLADLELRSSEALSSYIAEANSETLSGELAEAYSVGWQYEACVFKRSSYLYRGMVCYTKGIESRTTRSMVYWAPTSVLNPFRDYHWGKSPVYKASWTFDSNGNLLSENVK